jgi:hypothetical protein
MKPLGKIAVLKIYLFDFRRVVAFGNHWVAGRYFRVGFQKVALFVVALDAGVAGLIHRVFGDILILYHEITTLEWYILAMSEFK